jgi:hypothetical protein
LSAAALSSCTTAYKTGQTPDDVYFSPAPPQEEYVRVDKKEDQYRRGADTYSDDYYEDRFLRMRLTNRYRWSALDDYYFYNAYAYNAYGRYDNWYSPWNSYWTWNTYYNPYCGGVPYYPGTVIIKNPRVYTPPSRAAVFNPNSYINNVNAKQAIGSRVNSSYNNNNSNRYNNNNSNRSTLGQSVKKVFSSSNSNSGSNYSNSSNNSTPSRSYNSSSNSSSSSSRSSGGSSGGGGSSSRPPR